MRQGFPQLRVDSADARMALAIMLDLGSNDGPRLSVTSNAARRTRADYAASREPAITPCLYQNVVEHPAARVRVAISVRYRHPIARTE
jgi:hypothetical protein